MRLRGVSFDTRGRPFDCFQQVYPAAEVVFSISGQTARHVFRGPTCATGASRRSGHALDTGRAVRGQSHVPERGRTMSDVTIRPPRDPVAPGHGGGGLKANALRIGDVVIMALASSGPTQSIAVWHRRPSGRRRYYHTLVPILICFIPMIGIAIGYQRLNAWQPSAGATYSWVGRALNPHAGFFAGWIMLMYYTIGTTSLTVPLGTYFLSFFSNTAANNKYWVALVGSVFNILVLIVAALGIKLSARFNWVWAVFEYALLIGFSRGAIVMIYSTGLSRLGAHLALVFTLPKSRPHHRHPDRHLPLLGLGHRRLRRRGGQGQAGRPAAILSVVILFFIYSFVIFAFQGIAPNGDDAGQRAPTSSPSSATRSAAASGRTS